jgi:hypothetical protein
MTLTRVRAGLAFRETLMALCIGTRSTVRALGDGTNRAPAVSAVADRARDRDSDRIDILVYLLWVAVLLVLLRYV